MNLQTRVEKMIEGYSDVLIGLQYGDEGKAKVIDLIAGSYNIIARFNGGSNAGHTIQNKQGKIALKQIPSGIFYPNMLLYIGSGCALDIMALVEEIEEINRLGINLDGRLHISDQVTLVQPHHIIIDEISGKVIGTTKNGIGPAYADKASRMDGERLLNVRPTDLLEDPKTFFEIIYQNLRFTMERHSIRDYNIEEVMQQLRTAFDVIAPYVQRDPGFLEKQVSKGSKVLFEGAQSYMLDVTKGSVPYVTSSNTVAGFAYVGGDLPPKYHRKTFGVVKAIMSRVGHGPFVSEFGGQRSEDYCMEDGGNKHTKEYERSNHDPGTLLKSKDPFEQGIALRMLGGEYGTVTGRPRRIGMLDLVQLSHAIKMNGVDQLFVNKCDLLGDFSETIDGTIPLVGGYQKNGQDMNYLPTSNHSYQNISPTIENYPSFKEDISIARSIEETPPSLRQVLDRIQQFTSCEIAGIGTGPARDHHILLK